jgi:ribonucleoside-diphosphate reductase alpha chain
VKRNINRPVRELPLAEDTDMDGLSPNHDGNGKGHSPAPAAPAARAVKTLSESVAHFQQDAPTCPNCGSVTVRNGACYKCLNCGESLGCS